MTTVTPRSPAIAPVSPGTWHPLAAPTAGSTEPAARFRYDVHSGEWGWSPGGVDLDGLALEGEHAADPVTRQRDTIGTVTPPDHVAHTGSAMDEPFCGRHRVVDAQGRIREVLSVGEAERDAEGRTTAVRGFVVDLTTAFATATSRAVESALAVERRRVGDPVVEQAKGVLMAAFGLTADAAAELLSWRSEESGTELPELARGLVAQFGSLQDDGQSAARRACAYLGLTALDGD